MNRYSCVATMTYTNIEDVIIAILIFSIFMSVPLMLYAVCNRRAPRWYRLARASVRMFVRALRTTPL